LIARQARPPRSSPFAARTAARGNTSKIARDILFNGGGARDECPYMTRIE
jgi:hypothetical protein